eukprot:3922627-Rhodomonas_salina.2
MSCGSSVTIVRVTDICTRTQRQIDPRDPTLDRSDGAFQRGSGCLRYLEQAFSRHPCGIRIPSIPRIRGFTSMSRSLSWFGVPRVPRMRGARYLDGLFTPEKNQRDHRALRSGFRFIQRMSLPDIA